MLRSDDEIATVAVLPNPKRHLLIIFVFMLTYWFQSGGLTLFNKWFFSTRGFHFPILVVMGTMCIHWLLTFSFRCLSTKVPSLPKKQVVSGLIYTRYLIPIGLFTGLEIASSNLALMRLSVSFHTMVHASKPVFIAGWAVVMGLEKITLNLIFVVTLVFIGVLLLSVGESTVVEVPTLFSNNSTQGKKTVLDPGFDADGFALVLFSCFISGARWSFVQLSLQRLDVDNSNPDNDNNNNSNSEDKRLAPFNLIYYISPIALLSLFPFFLSFEQDKLFIYLQEKEATGDLYGFEFVVSIWSLCLSLTEFYFVRFTSGLALSFAAISKELLVVMLSLIINGDQLPILNVFGFFLCISGIVLHHKLKHTEYKTLNG